MLQLNSINSYSAFFPLRRLEFRAIAIPVFELWMHKKDTKEPTSISQSIVCITDRPSHSEPRCHMERCLCLPRVRRVAWQSYLVYVGQCHKLEKQSRLKTVWSIMSEDSFPNLRLNPTFTSQHHRQLGWKNSVWLRPTWKSSCSALCEHLTTSIHHKAQKLPSAAVGSHLHCRIDPDQWPLSLSLSLALF